jgi:hypothetical protein
MFLLTWHSGLSVATEAASWGVARRGAGGSRGGGGSRVAGGSRGGGRWGGGGCRIGGRPVGQLQVS